MIVLDIETTDVPPGPVHIINIGAVDFLAPERQFHAEIRVPEGYPLHPGAAKHNGYTQAELADARRLPLDYALRRFQEWAFASVDATIGAMNPKSDADFLQEGFAMAGMSYPFGWRYRDLHSTAADHLDRRGISAPLEDGWSKVNSDFIMRYVGLPNEPKPHRYGITGAQWEAEAWSRLLFGKALWEDLAQHPVPDYLEQTTHGPRRQYARIIPSAVELR